MIDLYTRDYSSVLSDVEIRSFKDMLVITGPHTL